MQSLFFLLINFLTDFFIKIQIPVMVEKNENDSKKSSDSTKYGDNQEPEFKGLMTPKTITIIFNIAIFFGITQLWMKKILPY